MQKFLKIFLILAFCLTSVRANAGFINFATHNPFNGINRMISDIDLNKQSTISISVKNLQTGAQVYSKNQNKLVHPASSLKVLTFASALATLGEDYQFSTTIFADKNNNLYIRLGADPLLTSADLKDLAEKLKKNYNTLKINKIYIDDTIIDKTSYPDGWMSDDLYPNTPLISPYTLNNNSTTVKLLVPNKGHNVTILQPNPYKHSFINELKPGAENSVELKKTTNADNPIIHLVGTIAYDDEIVVPVSNPKYNFVSNFNYALGSAGIGYNSRFEFAKTPQNAVEIAQVGHSIKTVGSKILKESDNFASEIVFKVAGAKFKNKTQGSTLDGIEMFCDYYKRLGFETEDIKISDASGISRYNLVSAEWMSSVLVKLFNTTNIKNYLAQPNEGTMAKRLRHLSGKIWVKTGTLKGVSALSGLVQTRSGKELVFFINISNFNKTPSAIKSFEDDLLDEIWKW